MGHDGVLFTDLHARDIMLKKIFLNVVNFEPVKWIINFFKLMITCRFIFMTIAYFAFVIGSFYDGYNAIKKLNAEYGLEKSADYISVSAKQCTFYYDIKDLNIPVYVTGDSTELACEQPANMQNIYDTHKENIRGIHTGDPLIIYPFAFLFFVGVLYMNTNPKNIFYNPTETLSKYCVAWVIYAVMLYPTTFGVYGSTSMVYDQTGTQIIVSSGKITNTGRWMYQSGSYFGQLKNTHEYDSPRDL